MLHINKVKTFDGLKYAVVNVKQVEVDADKVGLINGVRFPITEDVKTDKNKNVSTEKVTLTVQEVVEYKESTDTKVAIFPLTAEGLEKAKEIQQKLNK